MDVTSIVILSIAGIASVVLVGLLVYIRKMSGREVSAQAIAEKGTTGEHNRLRFVYDLFRALPPLRPYFVKTRKKVEIMYPSGEFDVQKRTSGILFRALLAGTGGTVLTFMLSYGDIFFICSGLVITFVAVNEVINKSLEAMDRKFLNQLVQALTSVRHYFYQTKNVEYAIRSGIDDLPYEIGLHMQVIQNILKNPNTNSAVDQYVGTEPNRFMLLFVSVCSSVKEFGDTYGEDGSSHFVSQLDYLKGEVENEILDAERRDEKFSGLAVMALAPVVAVKPLEMWARSNMEEIAQYYEGVYGIVAMVVIFAICAVTYALIGYLKEGNNVIERYENAFTRLLAFAKDYDAADIVYGTGGGGFAKRAKRGGLIVLNAADELITKIIDRHYTKYMRYDDDMKGMGDHTGPKAFLLKRYTYAAVAVLTAVGMFFFADFVQRNTYVGSWDKEFRDTVVPNEQYRDTMRETAEIYVASRKEVRPAPSGAEIAKDLQDSGQITDKQKAEEAAKTIEARIRGYQHTYFKWWYLIVAAAIASVAFMAPVWVLKFRQGLIDMRKQEEVIQFQSLMLILMHTPGTSIGLILEWMERFSYCFKDSITRCRVSVNHGHERALKAMKAEQAYEPFREFIDSLIAIDDVGVVKAFDEIKSDREYFKKQRELTNEKNLRRKSSRAQMIVFIPMFTTLILYLLVPMGMYAVHMLQEFQQVTAA